MRGLGGVSERPRLATLMSRSRSLRFTLFANLRCPVESFMLLVNSERALICCLSQPQSTQNFNKVDWSTRLRNLRGNLKQSEFAERIGLDRSYISQLETGKRPILEDVQRRILQMEAELAKPHQSTAMLKEATPTRPPRRIPVVSYAQAGEGGNFDDLANQIEEWVTTDSRDPNVFAVIIEGQSMEPAFFPGDIVVVAPNSEPRTNDIVLAREAETGKVWLKK